MKFLSLITTMVMGISSTATNTVTECTDTLSNYAVSDEQVVTCSVSAKSVSLHNIIAPIDVFFTEENCAEIFVNLLEASGYTPIYSGTTDEWFYLSAIEGIDTSGVSLTEDAKAMLCELGADFTDSVSVDSVLSEFDFTDCSGWIFTVNGEIPSVAMCDYVPLNGDIIELHFTLYYGEDIIQ